MTKCFTFTPFVVAVDLFVSKIYIKLVPKKNVEIELYQHQQFNMVTVLNEFVWQQPHFEINIKLIPLFPGLPPTLGSGH